MSARMFPLGDVISVATDYQTSPRGMAGTRELLEHMVGHAVMSSQMPEVMHRCRPELLRQHPMFATPKFTGEIIGNFRLRMEFAADRSRVYKEHLLLGWLSGLQSGRYGMRFEAEYPVTPIPVLPKVERKQLSHLDLLNRWMPRYICAKCGRERESTSWACQFTNPKGERCDGEARTLTVEESNERFAKLVRRILQADAPSYAGMILNARTVFFTQGSMHIYGDCLALHPNYGNREFVTLDKQANRMTPDEWLATLQRGYEVLRQRAESEPDK